MGKRNQTYTTTLGNAIGDAINALEQFAGDIRESADSMAETFPSAERTQTYEGAADALEGIETDEEVPSQLIDVSVTYLEDTRKGLTKAQQLGNLQTVWAAIAEAAELATTGTTDEDLQAYVESLRTVTDELDAVDI